MTINGLRTLSRAADAQLIHQASALMSGQGEQDDRQKRQAKPHPQLDPVN